MSVLISSYTALMLLGISSGLMIWTLWSIYDLKQEQDLTVKDFVVQLFKMLLSLAFAAGYGYALRADIFAVTEPALLGAVVYLMCWLLSLALLMNATFFDDGLHVQYTSFWWSGYAFLAVLGAVLWSCAVVSVSGALFFFVAGVAVLMLLFHPEEKVDTRFE